LSEPKDTDEELQDDPAVFFDSQEDAEIFLSRAAAIRVAEECHMKKVLILAVAPGVFDKKGFEPSFVDDWEPVACEQLATDQVWRSNRDAANFIRACRNKFNAFLITAEKY